MVAKGSKIGGYETCGLEAKRERKRSHHPGGAQVVSLLVIFKVGFGE